MNAPLRRFLKQIAQPQIECLEMRRLLSAALPGADVALGGADAGGTTTATAAVLTGVSLNAQTGQFFRAVVGTIKNFPLIASIYRIRASINWGDGSPTTLATFARQKDGALAVIGGHIYASVGTDDITVTVTAVPPPLSLAPVLLIGAIHSTATVFAPNGGVTLERTVGVSFTARVAFFRTTISQNLLGSTIDWGDGSQSPGKIILLPTANPLAGGTYAVEGNHTYAATGSYLVHTTVYELTPTVPGGNLGVGPTVIAKVDSVIDVLPISPVAALLPGDANGDGVVDINDLGALATNFGDSTGDATWNMGDFNDDGNIDIADLGALATDYGTVASIDVATATGSAATTAVGNAGVASATTSPAVSSDAPTRVVSSIDDLFSATAIS